MVKEKFQNDYSSCSSTYSTFFVSEIKTTWLININDSNVYISGEHIKSVDDIRGGTNDKNKK